MSSADAMRSSRTVLVTGGSRGIGAATARLAAAEGYRVVIAYLENVGSAEAVVRDITGKRGWARAFQADVADPAAVEALFEKVGREAGPLYGLVNSAGSSGGFVSLAELSTENLQRVVAVNLLGTFYCVREAAKRMSKSRGGAGGAIVNLTSETARFGGNRLSAYAAAKAGVSTMTIGVARELTPEGIRINAVSPGVIDTDEQAGLTEARRAELAKSLPMGRMGTAEEVAATILWLLSDEASYVTGAIVPVHGGR